ncbi:MAG: hypothetical protein K6A67_06160 [Bacteroidales bacterium]|nr:hypothetical protein [Bacteroidales bacterium]
MSDRIEVRCTGYYMDGRTQRWADFTHTFTDMGLYNRVLYNKDAQFSLLRMYYPDARELVHSLSMQPV